MDTPIAPSGDGTGRGENGRFAKGNPGGTGNPHARRVGALRSALLDAVTPDDVAEMVRALIARAKAGDVPAIKVLFERLLGPAVAPEEHERRERAAEESRAFRQKLRL